MPFAQLVTVRRELALLLQPPEGSREYDQLRCISHGKSDGMAN
jgi:hypothetical protein